ncbi:MAG: hypothetical protein ACO3LT_06635 [Ilumatobacteraceae bacterium]
MRTYLRYLIALLLPLVAQAQDTTIADYTDQPTPASGDLLYLLDVDDLSDGVDGSNKKVTIANLKTAINPGFGADAYSQITPTNAIVLDEATGNEVALSLAYTVNKATSGDDTGLKINMTDTASPGTSLLADFQVGGTSKFSFSNSGSVAMTGQSLTGSEATSLLDMASTWNTTGTPTAMKLNVTDTASNAASLLMDLQVGGASKFKVDKSGNLTTGQNIYGPSGYKIVFSTGGSLLGELNLYNALRLGGTSSYATYLQADAAGILAQRNSTNAQESRIYNTYTSASNGEWLELGFQDTSNTAVIKTNANGSGTVRDLSIDAPLVGIGTTSPSSVLDVDGTIETKIYTVSTLPSAAVPGQMAFVSDSSVAHAGNSGAVVAGGSTNFVPVYSDGTDWRIH